MNNPNASVSIKSTLPSTYVAFLDVLGFRQLVENNDHAYLEHVYLNTLSGNITHALANEKYVIIHSKGQETLAPDTRKVSVNSLLVSDSIIIWSENDSMQSFADIILIVRNLMAFSAFDGLLLRGAISVGPLTMQMGQEPSQTHNFQHTLFGKALVKARSLEEDQQWSGCAISDDAIKCFMDHSQGKSLPPDNSLTIESIIGEQLICRYLVPLKSGDKEMFVINWVNHHQATTKTSTILSAFPAHNKLKATKLSGDNSIQAKINNTLKFVKHVNPLADENEVSTVFKGLH